MKQTKHKILSVFLSVCMILTCMVGMSATASANVLSEWESGDCLVKLDGTTITVTKKEGSGDGKMADYTDEAPAPWYSVKDNVTSIVISDGVTSIGAYAFYNFGNVTSLSIADTVTNIGDSAFSNCGSLNTITIPSSITSIGSYAFYSSTAGRIVTFIRPESESSLTVADGAFYYSATLAYSDGGNYSLFAGDSEIELSGTNNGDKLNGKTLTWKIPTYSIATTAENGTVTATVGDSTTAVTKAEKDDTVTLTVTPSAGYKLKSIKATSPKDQPESFSDLVSLMGTAEFAGQYETTGYICKVVNDGFAVYNGTTTITEATASNATQFAFSDMAGYTFKCGDVYWQFSVTNGKITYISANNGSWLFDGDGKGTSNGALIPDDITLTTVTEGKKYTFTMPKKKVTVTAEFEKKTTWTVTFDADGGSAVDAQEVEDNKTATKPTAPIKTGYTFKEWQLDGAAYDFTAAVTKDIELKAVWEEVASEPTPVVITKYKITMSNGGKAYVNDVEVTEAEEGATVTIAADEPAYGTEFNGWTSSTEGVAFEDASAATTTFKMPASDVEITASYQEIPADPVTPDTTPVMPTYIPTPTTPIVDIKNYNITGKQDELNENALTWDDIPNASAYSLYIKVGDKYVYIQDLGTAKKADVVHATNGKYYVSTGKDYTIYEYDSKKGTFTKTGTLEADKIETINKANNVTEDFMVKYTVNGKESTESNSYKVSVKIYYKPALGITAGDGFIRVNWAKVVGAERYRAYKVVNDRLKFITETDKLALRVNGTKPGREYAYAVKALVKGEWTTVYKSDVVRVTAK